MNQFQPRQLEEALADRFGFAAFRPGQRSVVEAILAGEEVVAVMPTGAGKSLCYQLPALMLPGLTLVVSPLIALMKDQVDGLVARGVPAAFLNSSQSLSKQEEILERVAACALPARDPGQDAMNSPAGRGPLKLLYVAPERLRSARFVEAMRGVELELLAIDEAHCISQWGHDFRPDYTRLGELRRVLGPKRVAALTATATQEVRQDIALQLELQEAHYEVHGFDRPELWFGAEQLHGDKQKRAALKRALGALDWGGADAAAGSSAGVSPGDAAPCAIVYCATRKHTEQVTEQLQAWGYRAMAYHAGLGASRRDEVQDAFMTGAAQICVATNAFGMGVDKATIRQVIHYDLPPSLEAYYQEAGRAGRDGKVAKALLLWGPGDLRLRQFLIDAGCPLRGQVDAVWRHLCGRGPGVLSGDPKTLGERAGIDPEVTVSVLRLLEKPGYVRLESRSPRQVRVEVLRPGSASSLSIDANALSQHRRLEHARLDKMVNYARGGRCRRHALLDYFGDPAAKALVAGCASCDVCEQGQALGRRAHELGEEERGAAQQAFVLLAAVDGRFGRKKLGGLLAGEMKGGLAALPIAGHPLVGVLGGLGTEGALAFLDQAEALGLIRVHRDPYPLLYLCKEGSALARGEGEVPELLALLLLQDPEPPPSAGGGSKGQEAVGPILRKRKGKAAPATSSVSKLDSDPEPDPEGFEALRALRWTLANEAELPAFRVFSDRVLRSLLQCAPTDAAQLLEVSGIGPMKLELYGAAILAFFNERVDGERPI